ncbi:MAG: serine protease [Candidatus Obscuribacterales bacterium]|nr:serine protease [Candidatus Obscuribacterales bacterium]
MPLESPNIPVLKPGIDLVPPSGTQPAADAAALKLYEDATPAVVQIDTNRGRGTGFFVDKDGTIVTAAHVVLGTNEHFAVTKDGTRYRLQIEKIDDINDLAVMRPLNMPANRPFLALAPDSNLKAKQELFALGHPEGLRPAYISPGTYRAPSTTLNLLAKIAPADVGNLGKRLHTYTPKELFDLKDSLERPLVNSDLHIRHGNSGGPLVDANQKVVGVSDMINPSNPSESYFVPVEKIHDLMDPRNKKFSFTYSRMPEQWTQNYLSNWQARPGLAMFQTSMVGACGYAGFEALRRAPLVAGTGFGAYGVVSFGQDFSDLLNATDPMDRWKYGLSSAADLTVSAGALAMMFPKTRPYGIAAIGLGVAGRTSTDFIRNRLVLTDTSRTNGETRAPYDLDF